MKWTKGKIATHAAVFALAFLAAVGVGTVGFSGGREKDDGVGKEEGEGSLSVVRPERPGRPGVMRERGREGTGEKFRAEDFRKAWDAIARRDVTISERMQLQMAVLRQWSMVDLEGAMEAALSVHWDGDGGAETLLDSPFEEAFRARPLEAWDLIVSGGFGLGAELVKELWAAAVVEKHPMLVMSALQEMPSSRRGEILKAITSTVARGDAGMKEEFLGKLCELPQTGQLSTWMSETIRKLGPSGTAAEVGAKLVQAKTPQEVTRYIHELGLALKSADIPTILVEWEKLPPELRSRAATSALLHADPKSDIPALVTEMGRMGGWNSIGEQRFKISEYGYNTGKLAELADWTATLPDRPESRGIMDQAIEPYIVNNPAGAKTWIESLPAGDWRRDRALAEYSRHVLWRMNSKEQSTWAIDGIADPKVKEHVLAVRAAWARERGVDP